MIGRNFSEKVANFGCPQEDRRKIALALRCHPTQTLLRKPHVSARIVSALARFGEGCLIAGIGFFILAIYVGDISATITVRYIVLILVASGSIVALLHISGAYTVHALLFSRDQIAHLLLAWTLSFTAVCIFIFFSKLGDYSRIWLGGWYVSGLAISLAGRAAFSRLCRHWNKNGQFNRCAVLVGGGKAASELIKSLGKTKGNDVTIVGIFDDRSDERSPPVVNGYPRLGTVDELLQFARKVRIDLLLVTFPISAENRLLHVLRKLWVLPVDIRLSAHTQRLRYRPRAYSHIGHVAFLDLFDRPIAGWDALIKSTSDKMIALMAIVVLAPLLAAVWLAVRLDSKGPAIFKQKRYGFNNELIEVYKFRSMHFDQTDPTAKKLTIRNDPRVTRLGRFIRKTSLDELPQLFNVLRGELSMVGPRPHATNANVNDTEYSEIVEEYFARTRVKPGITGWAQVNGWRGNTDTVEKLHRRLEHDLYYIENWSLIFDLIILARTPFAVLLADEAY
jgi:Undecaprenyl-phosphate glucose phosphotransferase